jgi:hypothetical protein
MLSVRQWFSITILAIKVIVLLVLMNPAQTYFLYQNF